MENNTMFHKDVSVCFTVFQHMTYLSWRKNGSGNKYTRAMKMDKMKTQMKLSKNQVVKT